MRQKIVAGNWKMNCTLEEARKLFSAIIDQKDRIPEDTQVILGPPYLYLHSFFRELPYDSNIYLTAQNCYSQDNGAFTGEIAAPMLKSVGAKYCIVGHSERRHFFGETDDEIARKVDAVHHHGLTPIFCCGETLERRKENKHFDTVKEQLQNSLSHLSSSKTSNLVIAYEPVWAIGTGETASPEQAQEMHGFIREELQKIFNEEIAEALPLLYGGSCKPDNAKELFSKKDVDGGLIGGASLKSEDFLQIAEATSN